MDSNDIFKKIKEFGQSSSKREELQKYCNQKINEIINHLPRKILSNDGAGLIDCILIGLSGNAHKKSQVIDIVIKSIRKEPMSIRYCGDVVSRLSLELSKLPTDILLKWSNESIQTVIDDSDVNMIWRDVLPECLNIICSQPVITHCGTKMSGIEYKIQCIHTLCQCTWKEKQLIQLTAMFIDIQLTKENQKQVVNKICSYITNVPPDTLPPLVHQLLILCKQYHLEIVLSHLSHYFSVRLYCKPTEQDSESTTMDVEDIVQHSQEDLSRCLSTCLYYLSQGLADPEIIRKHIKQWPKTQLLRAPFLIDVALAVSDKGYDFRSVCLEVIKSAIDLRLQDDLRSRESSWVKSVLPTDVDVASVFKALVTESANHRLLTVMGLINLSFSLLAVIRTKPTASRCWALGQTVLVKLCKAQPETTSHILSQLADKLLGDTQSQYAECLYILCKQDPILVERCSQVPLIVENCQGPDAAKIYDALRPLMPFSEKTRDSLLKVCKKHLYSGFSSRRRLSVSGFLCVLRHTRLSLWSEPTQSSHIYLTPLTVDLHVNERDGSSSRGRNESLFLEIVSVLRRCLVQDAAVKQFLYSEIYTCVKDKKALHEPILEMLNEHLSKYLPEEDEGPVLLDKCVAGNGDIIEPIGHLLYAIGQFLQNQEVESDDVVGSPDEMSITYCKNKLTAIMQKLCQADWLDMVNLESLSDLTVESKVKTSKVQLIMQCYEALIAHTIMQRNLLNANENTVHRLHKAYNQLLENTKAPSKVKKGKANETKDSSKSQNNQNEKKNNSKDKGKTPVTFASAAKDKAGPFKPLPCPWDLQMGLRVLDLLYGAEVSWSTTDHRNQVRIHRSFHLFSVRNVQAIITECPDKRQVAQVPEIAGLIYTRCICKFQDLRSFDEQVMFACLELFKACLNLLLSPAHGFKTEDVLSDLTGAKDSTESACLADVLGALYTSMEHLEAERAEDSLDAVGRKTYGILVQICAMMMAVPIKPCFILGEMLSKLESLCRRSSLPDMIPLSAGYLTAAARDAQDVPFINHMLDKLAVALECIYDGESLESQTEDFPSIDEKTGHPALSMLCTHLTGGLKCIDHLILRAKDLSNATGYTPLAQQYRIQTELKELYEAIQIQLCQMTSWTKRVAMLRCYIGSGSDKVLNLCVKLYSLLAAYVKLLDLNMAHTLHLEKLLKLSGRKLSQVTDAFVSYVEASQTNKSILKDTRLVPRLVKDKELFHKNVVMLGEKNYHQYLSMGNARDFKIVKPILEDKLNALGANTQSTNVDDDDVDDGSTLVLDELMETESDLIESPKKKRRAS